MPDEGVPPPPEQAGETGYAVNNYRPTEPQADGAAVPGPTQPGEGLQGTYTESGMFCHSEYIQSSDR